MQDAGLAAPKFVSSPTENSFSVTISLHQLMDENAVSWLNQFHDFGLTSEEARILVYTKKNGSISNKVCRTVTGYDAAKSSALLTKLRRSGILCQHSRGPATQYTISESYLGEDLPRSDLLDDNLSESENVKNECECGVDHEEYKNREHCKNHDDYKNYEQCENESDLENESKAIIRNNLLESLPDSLRNEIENLGSRTTPEIREDMITKVCSVRAFSASEIGIIFGNTRAWAKNTLKELESNKKIKKVGSDISNNKTNNKNQTYYCCVDERVGERVDERVDESLK